MLIQFDARLLEVNAWTIMHLPNDVSAQLPSRSPVMVTGTINDLPFQTPLEPDGNGSHWFRIDDQMQKSINAGAGDTVTVAIEPTKNWPEPEIPADWAAALKSHPDIQALWSKITPMARHEWLRWIGSTSNTDTRQRRIEVSCSKLSKGMRRPCCFNRAMCCIPDVSKNGVLLEPAVAAS